MNKNEFYVFVDSLLHVNRNQSIQYCMIDKYDSIQFSMWMKLKNN